MGISGKYASVADFFNEDGSEKLALQLQNSFAKKDIDKNVFDKELIKANERMNIALQSMNGLILNIFPFQVMKITNGLTGKMNMQNSL